MAYTIGVDFGTLSGRAVLVHVETGEELASAVKEYRHAVIDTVLPKTGHKLPRDWALQDPADYLEVLETTIPSLLEQTDVEPKDIIGIGIDFTACTILPVDSTGQPLCMLPEYEEEPHSYVKLWKHHAAQKHADRLNQIAEEEGEAFLQRYGGKISSEWMIPKVMQIAEEAPHIYEAADRIIEAADWIVYQLCGSLKRSNCTAGYKAIWSEKAGYPSEDFFGKLNPLMKTITNDKLAGSIHSVGEKAGGLTEKMAQLTGLLPGTAVAVANVDAHVSVPAVGITEPGKMLMIMGTSTCHVLLGDEVQIVPGMCGVVDNGILPGYAGYEAGQSCVGDHFDWFVKTCVPQAYREEAEEKNIGVHELLSEKANLQAPGESGLLALDWWNGNRSTLVDADLTGMLLGMTLLTKPEEIYRALVEATAYGTRMIIETFKESGVPIEELYAAGGIAEKNPFVMQIYADVTNMDIKISGSPQAPALGSAIFGALAAGKENGGYDDIKEAAAHMGKLKDISYTPNAENAAVYEKLYAEYKELVHYFGKENHVMKRLKTIKNFQFSSAVKKNS
ncbi:ribulokinase [Bacillus spizizenii ATCC 6633 = JCM 2499]|uniref:Ribulokinase n=2 Tax=Bacillus spizizenii TaxID=96241 RepID=E0TW07_BACSH|nr:ribulokinase [Bacillus spizizenii]QCJ17953.1 ribulokinase [Bacillus subtilis]ADM38835.1 ribulokinase [Bacillus spizizenii str. W23]AJW84371.1 ribulokinase [Bacillus spizizenii]EFG92044.1 ribulokinase [Bacillus spizizenii ATCC 6633 = JCM 2499]KFK79265.1 L-ribulokinase [Bacillus spizizenii]